MEKAKIILTAIAVLAVVGGALAFKAKRGPFLAYTLTGQRITNFVVNGFTYRTIVPLCSFTGAFIAPDGPTTITLTDLFKTITGYSTLTNGVPVSATSVEFVCTPTITATTGDGITDKY
jgi:hypothetical protein